MTEYHKIETLYERDEKTHKLKPALVLKNPVYGIIKSWHWTEKIDGTNIRCIWKYGKLTFGGRTDAANIPADLVNWLNENITAEKMAQCFHNNVDAVIYGEGYGAGIQAPGKLYSPIKKFIVFDIRIGDRWWMTDDKMRAIATQLGLDAVPSMGSMSLEEAVAIVKVGFKSKLGDNPPSEGMVGRPVEPLFDHRGQRLIVKLKTKDFGHLAC